MAGWDTTRRQFDLNKPLIIYAKCTVEYDGRAKSVLDNGNYLIIYKSDGSLLIHAGTKVYARNYQQSGSKLTYNDNKIVATRKSETITIFLDSIHYQENLEDWSQLETKLVNRESDLVDKLEGNLTKYINIDAVEVKREFSTPMGKVDLYAVDSSGLKHVIEVKRVKATKSHCNQLRKYLDCIENSVGYIASPSIGKSTVEHMDKKGYNWIKIDFD